MTIRRLIPVTAVLSSLAITTMAVAAETDNLAVKITPTVGKVDIKHKGSRMAIMRNQDENNVINPEFANTSRKCPPFCIQPATLAPGVETIGEIEVLGYLKM